MFTTLSEPQFPYIYKSWGQESLEGPCAFFTHAFGSVTTWNIRIDPTHYHWHFLITSLHYTSKISCTYVEEAVLVDVLRRSEPHRVGGMAEGRMMETPCELSDHAVFSFNHHEHSDSSFSLTWHTKYFPVYFLIQLTWRPHELTGPIFSMQEIRPCFKPYIQ